MNRLRQFWNYAAKVFDLPSLLGAIRDRREQPVIPTRAVVASLFLPLSFLTGFYGMNFAYLTQVLESPYLAFVFGVATMLIATGIQLWLFRRRGWI